MLSVAPPERPLIALSGGADSCALLLLWCEAAHLGLLPYPAGVAHLHHGMRGRDADADAGFCAALAARCGLPCVVGLGALKGANEAEAREARYAFLSEAAQELGAEVIATGHHADDQAETVLLRLFRGTSVAGLGGIPVRRGNVIRPLLFARRAELERYCAQQGVTPRHDPTNDDPRYPRQRVRTLLPELAQSFNPRLTEALCRLADHAQTDAACLDALAEEAAEGDLCLLYPALRQRRVRRLLWEASADNPALREELVTTAWVERLESLLWTERRLDLPGGWEAFAKGSELVVQRKSAPAQSVEFMRSLSVPGTCFLPEGVRLVAELAPPLASSQRSRRARRIDCGFVPERLTVRTVRAGDRMAPLGMGGKTRLVRDLLREAGVPAPLRSQQLVVEADTEILWLVGVAQSERTRAPDGAEHVLQLALHPPEPS